MLLGKSPDIYPIRFSGKWPLAKKTGAGNKDRRPGTGWMDQAASSAQDATGWARINEASEETLEILPPERVSRGRQRGPFQTSFTNVLQQVEVEGAEMLPRDKSRFPTCLLGSPGLRGPGCWRHATSRTQTHAISIWKEGADSQRLYLLRRLHQTKSRKQKSGPRLPWWSNG